jgi:serine/threonine-protein kinase
MAIYFSQDSGTYGYSWKQPTERAADNAAYDSCGKRDCQQAVVHDQCGALAIGDGNGWGGGSGGNAREAERAAIDTCRSYNNVNCRVEVSGCANGYGFE